MTDKTQEFISMINESLADTNYHASYNNGVYKIIRHQLRGALVVLETTSQLDVILYTFTALGEPV